MFTRFVPAIAVSVAFAMAAGAFFDSTSIAAESELDFEVFKSQVEPVFLKKREGVARCYQCHAGADNGLSLEPLSEGQTAWNEEQSRRNFEKISLIVVPGNTAESRLLIHPLAPEAGGDLFHSGGRQFKSKDDPDWRALADWVNGG